MAPDKAEAFAHPECRSRANRNSAVLVRCRAFRSNSLGCGRHKRPGITCRTSLEAYPWVGQDGHRCTEGPGNTRWAALTRQVAGVIVRRRRVGIEALASADDLLSDTGRLDWHALFDAGEPFLAEHAHRLTQQMPLSG